LFKEAKKREFLKRKVTKNRIYTIFLILLRNKNIIYYIKLLNKCKRADVKEN